MAKQEEIVLGEFLAQDNSEPGAVEVRLRDEKANSTAVLRHKSLRGSFERGTVYELVARVKEPAPEQNVITAEIPAEDRALLPTSAEIVDGGAKSKRK